MPDEVSANPIEADGTAAKNKPTVKEILDRENVDGTIDFQKEVLLAVKVAAEVLSIDDLRQTATRKSTMNSLDIMALKKRQGYLARMMTTWVLKKQDPPKPTMRREEVKASLTIQDLFDRAGYP